MSLAKPTQSLDVMDWDRMYREGLPPWETMLRRPNWFAS